MNKAISLNLSAQIGLLLCDSVALFCPKWACGAGIFSPDPVTMETGYIGHGEAFSPNSSKLGLDQPLVVF